MKNINETLETRLTKYGEYMGVATIAQNIKYVMQQTSNWNNLEPDQMESLDMIANKIARILNGDPNYDDSWHDIAGYATLVADRLRKSQVME
jgi:hypothetical protein